MFEIYHNYLLCQQLFVFKRSKHIPTSSKLLHWKPFMKAPSSINSFTVLGPLSSPSPPNHASRGQPHTITIDQILLILKWQGQAPVTYFPQNLLKWHLMKEDTLYHLCHHSARSHHNECYWWCIDTQKVRVVELTIDRKDEGYRGAIGEVHCLKHSCIAACCSSKKNKWGARESWASEKIALFSQNYENFTAFWKPMIGV